jgi:hypothetical protein
MRRTLGVATVFTLEKRQTTVFWRLPTPARRTTPRTSHCTGATLSAACVYALGRGKRSRRNSRSVVPLVPAAGAEAALRPICLLPAEGYESRQFSPAAAVFYLPRTSSPFSKESCLLPLRSVRQRYAKSGKARTVFSLVVLNNVTWQRKQVAHSTREMHHNAQSVRKRRASVFSGLLLFAAAQPTPNSSRLRSVECKQSSAQRKDEKIASAPESK